MYRDDFVRGDIMEVFYSGYVSFSYGESLSHTIFSSGCLYGKIKLLVVSLILQIEAEKCMQNWNLYFGSP